MKLKLLLFVATLLCSLTTVNVAQAQTKEELQELMNSNSTAKPAKEKPKKEPKAKEEKPKEEPKAEKKAASVKEEPKAEKKKEEPKKEPAKAEEKKAEPKKEEPKAEKKKEEPKKEEPKAEKKKEEPKPEKKVEPVVTPSNSKSVLDEKGKELPAPENIGWRKNKKLGQKLTQRGSIYYGLRYYETALSKKPKKTFLNQNLADGYMALRDYRTANRYYKTLVDLDSVKHKNLTALYQYALAF